MASESYRKEVIAPAPSPELPFSATVAYRDLIFVSGIVGRDPETKSIASGDIAAQTRQTLENIRRQLEQAGTSLERVLKVTIFLTDMRLFREMNDVYRQFFPVEPPARSCVAVVAVPDPAALVEIEVMAAR